MFHEQYVPGIEVALDAIDSLDFSLLNEEEPKIFLESCKLKCFEKLKFSKSEVRENTYLENYEAGLINDPILFELELQLDPLKTISSRSSEGVLAFLAKVGGFGVALSLILGWIG